MSSNGFNLFGGSLSSTSIPPAPAVSADNGFNEFGSPEFGLSRRVGLSGVRTVVGYNEFNPSQTPVPESD
jgi:hypothetical protein